MGRAYVDCWSASGESTTGLPDFSDSGTDPVRVRTAILRYIHTPAMSLDVFFSYDSEDSLLVGRLKDGIENRSDQDIDVYIYEEDHRFGEQIAQKAKDHIRQSDLVIVLITPNSRDSAWVHQEIGFAEGVDCPVVPIVSEDLDTSEITGLLKGAEYVEFDRDDPGRFFEVFLGYVRRTFDGSPSEDPTYRGGRLRADASDQLKAGNVERAFETYERSYQAYDAARRSANESDGVDPDGPQRTTGHSEEDLRAARRHLLAEELDSLRSRIDSAEARSEEDALDGAREEIEAIRSRLTTLKEHTVEDGFDDLHDEITALQQRSDGRLQEFERVGKEKRPTARGGEEGWNAGAGDADESNAGADGRRTSPRADLEPGNSWTTGFTSRLTDVDELDARTVALSTVSVGVVATMEYLAIQIGVGPSSYLSLGDVAIYAVAFLLGGVVGGLAGGVGTAVVQIILFQSIIIGVWWGGVKGLQGFVVGQVAGGTVRSKVVAGAASVPIVVVGVLGSYFFYGSFVSVDELVRVLVQVAFAMAIALPLSQALQRFVPRLR